MYTQLLHFTLEVDSTGYWYHLFYQIAVVAAFITFLFYGFRKKISIANWLLLSSTAAFCSILGTKVGTYGLEEWQQVWESGALLSNTNRTSIGAFVLGLAGIFFTIRILKLPKHSFDVYAYVIPVVVIFQRIGCLLASCCFGVPTGGAWGVQYNGVSFIRDHHIDSGYSTSMELLSAPVHPVPVYFIIGALLALLVLWKVKDRIKVSGNLALLSIGLILFSRFGIEFFRDAVTNHQMGEMYYGLKGVQWILLIAVVLLFIIVFWREKAGEKPSLEHVRNSLFPTLAFTTLLSLFILLSKDVFTPIEIGVLHVKLLLTWLAVGHSLVYRFQNQSLRWQALFMAVLSIGMMSQTYPEYEEDKTGTKEISISANFNEVDLGEAKYDCVSQDVGCLGDDFCSRYDQTRPYGPSYFYGSVGIDIKQYRGYSPGRKHSYIRYGVEYQPEYFYNEELDYVQSNYNFMPYFGFGNTKYLETKVGLHLGRFLRGDFDELNNKRNVMIAINQRIGNEEGFHGRIALFNAPNLGPSVNTIHASVNYNFTNKASGPLDQLSLGISQTFDFPEPSDGTIYLESAFKFNNAWLFSPRFGVGGLALADGSRSQGNNVNFFYGVGLKYSFETGKKKGRK